MFKKIVSQVVLVLTIVMTTGVLNPLFVTAASISTSSDVMSRSKQSTLSNHEIKFVTPTGLAAAQTITLTFSSDFTGVSSVTSSDVDFATGSTGVCSSATFTEQTLAASASGSTWGVGASGQVVTITSGTGTVTASRCVRIRIGDNATNGATGTNRITNGALDDDDTITIGGTFGDTGTITVDIIDDDQVTVSARVNQTMSFDLDAALTDSETSTPYTVDLGVLSSGSVSVSNGTSINTIYVEGSTNASGGMNVTVRNTNGANGLVSTSTASDKIPSTTGTMASGTSNYGLCVASANLTGYSRSSTYNTTCALSSSSNSIVGLSTTATDLVSSTVPVSNAHAEVVVNAAISGTQAAHDDYTDTLTFIATASY